LPLGFALGLVFVFFPALQPHVLHILCPFISGIQFQTTAEAELLCCHNINRQADIKSISILPPANRFRQYLRSSICAALVPFETPGVYLKAGGRKTLAHSPILPQTGLWEPVIAGPPNPYKGRASLNRTIGLSARELTENKARKESLILGAILLAFRCANCRIVTAASIVILAVNQEAFHRAWKRRAEIASILFKSAVRPAGTPGEDASIRSWRRWMKTDR